MVVLAIILMFQAFLRQSNLLPHSVALFDKTRQITVGDITDNGDQITIKVKWTKTQQVMGDRQVINLYAIPGSPLCPVSAYRRAQKGRHQVPLSAPLLSFEDGNPITLGYVKRVWGGTLKLLGYSPEEYSLHSLRRGGASFCRYQHQAELIDVKRHGGWRSDCVRAYLKPPPRYRDSVHRALSRL